MSGRVLTNGSGSLEGVAGVGVDGDGAALACRRSWSSFAIVMVVPKDHIVVIAQDPQTVNIFRGSTDLIVCCFSKEGNAQIRAGTCGRESERKLFLVV